MLQKFECFGVAGVLDVWASAKIDEFTDSVNTGHLAGRYLRLNQLSFVLIVREDIKSLLSGAVESFELVLCFYYLLDIGLYTLVI